VVPAHQTKRKYALRRANASLAVDDDLFPRLDPGILQQGAQLKRRSDRPPVVIGQELLGEQVESSGDMTCPLITEVIRLTRPFAIGPHIQHLSAGSIELGPQVVQAQMTDSSVLDVKRPGSGTVSLNVTGLPSLIQRYQTPLRTLALAWP